MKRRILPLTQGVKRLRRSFGPSTFPETEGVGLLSVDFSIYASTNDPDVVVTNGESEFEAHKEILKVCSSGLKELLEGDQKVTRLPMDVSNNILVLLKDVMYAKPDSSMRSYRRLSGFKLRCDALRVIAKWDFKILSELMINYVQERTFVRISPGYTMFYEKAMEFNLIQIAKTMEKRHINKIMYSLELVFDGTLFSGAKPELILKILKKYKFSHRKNFERHVAIYKELVTYAKNVSNAEVSEAVGKISLYKPSTNHQRSEEAEILKQQIDILTKIL